MGAPGHNGAALDHFSIKFAAMKVHFRAKSGSNSPQNMQIPSLKIGNIDQFFVFNFYKGLSAPGVRR
jgi:hypothetical protein